MQPGSTLWAIDERWLPAIQSGMIPEPSKPKLACRLRPRAAGIGRDRRGNQVLPAVIPLVGMLSMHGDYGGTSLADFMGQLSRAAADSSISRIIIDCDSPGGEIPGVPEAAALVAEVAKSKPVVAYVSTLCASAAYWIASQASEMVASSAFSQVGSIGVYTMHADMSRALDQQGVSVTILRKPELKAGGNPVEPLDPRVAAVIEQQLGDVYNAFLAAVAKGRGKPPATVASSFGAGLTVPANRGRGLGMVDRIVPPEQFIAEMLPGHGAPGPRGPRTSARSLPAPTRASDTPLSAGRASIEVLRLRQEQRKRISAGLTADTGELGPMIVGFACLYGQIVHDVNSGNAWSADPGAFVETAQRGGQRVLIRHDPQTEVPGRLTVVSDELGLRMAFRPRGPRGRELVERVRSRELCDLSVGDCGGQPEAKRFVRIGDRGRVTCMSQMRVGEISFTADGACPGAHCYLAEDLAGKADYLAFRAQAIPADRMLQAEARLAKWAKELTGRQAA